MTRKKNAYIRNDVFEPSILLHQLSKPLTCSRVLVFLSSVDYRVLVVNTGFWHVTAYTVKLWIGFLFESLQIRTWLSNGEIIGTSPGRGILDVVVTRHVFGDDCYVELLVLGQDQGSSQPDDTGTTMIALASCFYIYIYLPKRSIYYEEADVFV